jgi:hypothetical protein
MLNNATKGERMRCEVRRLHSPDAADLISYTPPVAETFGIFIQAMIGPLASEGEEAFGFTACTPSWLKSELMAERGRWGRGLLLVSAYDYSTILNSVQSLCSSVEADDWSGIAEKLSRYLYWEFEDYMEPSMQP